MIHDTDSDDSDSDAVLCASEDHFTELFRKCQSGLMAGSPSPGSSRRSSSDSVVLDEESPTSSKKSKESDDKGKASLAAMDLHEVSTDSCNSNDSDCDKILAEYTDFVKTYKGEPKKADKASTKKVSQVKKGPATRSATATVTAATAAISTKNVRGKKTAKKQQPPPRALVAVDIISLEDDKKPLNNNYNDDNNDILEVTAIEREQMTVRIRWKGDICRLRVYETDDLTRVKELFADSVGAANPRELVFYMSDGETPLDEWLTVKEAGIGFTTIIDALRRAPAKSSSLTGSSTNSTTTAQDEELRPHDPTLISLKIQDGSLRKKTTIIYVKKTAPLSKLPELYLEKAGLIGDKTPAQIKFMFDGERLDLSETPNSLEFEEDECIDVIIK